MVSTSTAIPLITIDGPSGSGKGTIATHLAKKLGYHLLDSGAIYRVLGLAAHRAKLALDDEQSLVVLAKALDVEFVIDVEQNKQLIVLQGDNVSDIIRTETVGTYASTLAMLSPVRAALLERQRNFLRLPGLIADGRDMGTVVFPDAPLKIFLTASAEERARRRYNQLKGLGETVKIESLIEEIKARDKRDTERVVAPLKPASDAILIDSTHLTADQVVDCILEHVSQHPIFN